jgi:hypothetical protein
VHSPGKWETTALAPILRFVGKSSHFVGDHETATSIFDKFAAEVKP